MFSLPNITTAKEIQKNYRQIFDEVKRTGKPVLVMRNNQPDVAIIDVKKLAELHEIIEILQSYKEAQEGKALPLKGSLVDLWHETQRD